tara:strand:+ start:58 stop:1113 length:1056 start_codon:yes stop_codon:yes gene_type:complete
MIDYSNLLNINDIYKLDDFFNNITEKTNTNTLIIKGSVGTGKTTLCNIIEEKYKDKYTFFTFGSDYSNNKNYIQDIVKHKNILSLFNNGVIRNGIILDNIKTVASFLKGIIKYKKKYFSYPIIIIIDSDFNEKLFNFKYIKIELKSKSLNELKVIYKDYKINNKILYSIIEKSYGDFNYINKTLLFIKLSPDISLIDIRNLNKDVNLNNYFLLLKFINSKNLIFEEYDYNFTVYLFKNIYNIFELLPINYEEKKKYISYIYKNVLYINNSDLINIFIICVKHILNIFKIRNIKYINTVPKSLLLNNNIKSINENIFKKDATINRYYFHNDIKKNINRKYDKFQKFLYFSYI